MRRTRSADPGSGARRRPTRRAARSTNKSEIQRAVQARRCSPPPKRTGVAVCTAAIVEPQEELGYSSPVARDGTRRCCELPDRMGSISLAAPLSVWHRAAQQRAEPVEPPYFGPGLKPFAQVVVGRRHAGRHAQSRRCRGARCSRRAALPLARGGGLQVSERSVRPTITLAFFPRLHRPPRGRQTSSRHGVGVVFATEPFGRPPPRRKIPSASHKATIRRSASIRPPEPLRRPRWVISYRSGYNRQVFWSRGFVITSSNIGT